MWAIVIFNGELGVRIYTSFDDAEQARHWARDNLLGYDERFGKEYCYIISRTYEPLNRHSSPCRICGEEGHTWQRCGND